MVSTPAGPNSRVFGGSRARWWRRVRNGHGFRIVDADGQPVRGPTELARCRSLAIPPAWRDVRISPSARSRLQAIGLDGQGRPQYLYHAAFVERQARKKFAKIERFGEQMPRLREVTSQHLRRKGLGRERVLALVLRLVNRLYLRPGSEVGVRTQRTYGITTLRNHHLRIGRDGRIVFRFDGKAHVRQQKMLVDPVVTGILRQLRRSGGPRLFKWFDEDGRAHAVSNQDLNVYLKSIVGPDFSLKDFRTWHGTLIVAKELARLGPAPTPRETKRRLTMAVKAAAERLGNTPAVCRRSYLHPLVAYLYEEGFTLVDVPLDDQRVKAHEEGLRAEEIQLLELFVVARDLRQARREHAAAQRQGAKAALPGTLKELVAGPPPVST